MAEKELPEIATIDLIHPDRDQYVQLFCAIAWRPLKSRIFVLRLTWDGNDVITPVGVGDTESPFPTPPLALGWAKLGTTHTLEWKARVFDDLSGIAAYINVSGQADWRRLDNPGTQLSAGTFWAGKGTFTP